MSKLRAHNDGTNLIINYLPQTTDEDELSAMFADCGMIEHVKVIRDGKTQISRGFAFIKYVDKESAERAIRKYSGHKMGRKTLRVSLSRPAGEETRDANLIMENLPLSMTEDILVEQFSVYGQIVTHRLLKNSAGKSKGKAYVRFNTKSEAEDAIMGLNGINIGGEDDLVVKFADPPVVKATPELLQSKKKQTMRATTQPYPPPVRNAPYRDPYLSHPEFPEYDLPTHTMPPRQGFGPRPGARPMMGPHRGPPFGKPDHAHVRQIPPPHQMSPPVIPRNRSVEPITSSFEDSSRIPENHRSSYDPEKGWCVFVYGIPVSSTNETLYSMFARYGAINTVKPVIDNEEMCKGYGFVHMINYDDACRAIQALDGDSYQGKSLQVRFKNAKK